MSNDNVPEIAKKIGKLYSALRRLESPEETASTINTILIYEEKIPQQLLSSAWDLFAQEKGAK